VCPTGQSISVSVAVALRCVRACVRAKLCAGVKGTMDPPGARPKTWKFVGVVPCRSLPAAPPDVPDVEKTNVCFSFSDRIRVLSSSCRVFP
jgi:hypothetical protein